MKVCIVTETYPPEVNGVAMSLQRIATGLRELGNEVRIIRPRQASEAAGTSGPDETIVPGLPLPGYKGLRMGLPCARRLRKLWTASRPDVIYVATEGPLGLSAIRAGRNLGIALTSGFHTNFHEYLKHYRLPFLERLAEHFLRRTHNRTLRTFAPSADIVARLEAMGIKNTRLLGRGVDTRLFSPGKRDEALRRSWGAGPDDIVAVFVSRIAAEKNIPLTLRAFSHIRERFPASVCVFVGDGPERTKLEKTNPQFHYAGMRKGEDLARHYASGDLFVFPSTTETFGNVVTEAMASGLVTVAYDYAAPRQLIEDGESGFLGEYADGPSYMEALDRALDGRDRWPEIRQAARTRAAELDWGSIVKKFAADLTEAVREITNPKNVRP